MTNVDPTIVLLLDSPAEQARCRQLLTVDPTWQPTVLDLDWTAILGETARSIADPPQPQIVFLAQPVYETHWVQLQAVWPDMPPSFLLLLNDEDEELASIALQAGVQDYLVKSQLNPLRLRHTIQLLWQQRQLQQRTAVEDRSGETSRVEDRCNCTQTEAALSQAEQALHQTETQLLLSLEFAGIGAWCWWPDTGQYIWYGGMETLLELPSGLDDMFEVWCDRIHPADREAVLQTIEQGLAQRTAFEAEYRYQLLDERWVWRYFKGQGQYSAMGELEHVLGVLLDLDQRKRGEAAVQDSERRHRDLIRALPDLIICMNREGMYLDLFTASNMTVVGGTALIGLNIYDQGLPTHLADLRLHHIQQALATGELQIYEQEFFNGEFNATEEVRISPTSQDEVLVIVRDITERKQAEAALQMSEQRLQMLIDALPFGVWMRDAQDRLVLQNTVNIERFGNHLGAVPADVPNLPNYAPVYFESKRRCQLGEYLHFEEWETVAGQDRYFHRIVGPFPDLNGTVGMFGVYIDITDRKQAELALRDSERRYATLTEISPVGIFRFDASGQCVYVNSRWCELTGRALAEVSGDAWVEILHPEDRNRLLTAWAEAMAQQTSFRNEGRHLRPDGTVLWFDVQMVPEFDDDGKLLGYVGTVSDISDRKQAELTLQEKEARFQQLAETVREGFFVFETATRQYSYTNPACEVITGSTFDAADAWNGWIDNVYAEDRDRVAAAVQRELEGEVFDEEYRFMRGDGELRWLRSQAFPLTDETGIITRIVGTLEDISDRKFAEAQLQEVTKRLTLATNAAEIGIWDLDLTQDHLLWDDRMYEIYGLKPSRAIHSTQFWEQRLHPHDAAAAQASLQATIAGTQEFHIEFRILWPDGQIRFIEAHAITLRDADGKALRMTGVNWDISDRKRAEIERQQAQAAVEQLNRNLEALIDERTAALRIREQELESLFNSAAVGMAQVEGQTHQFIKVNQRFCDLLGYSHTELAQLTFVDLTYAEDLERSQIAVEQLYQHEISDFSLEKRYVKKDGSLLWANTTVSLVWHPDGTPAYGIVVIEDISARKQTEIALRESEVRLRATFEQAAVGIVQASVTGHLVQVNQKFCDILGYSEVELLDQTFADVTHPDDLAQDQAHIQRLLAGEASTFVMEKRYICKDGTAVWANLSVSLVRNWCGEPQYFIGIIQDIRDRKQAEQQLQSERLRLELALESAQMGSWEAMSSASGTWSERTEAIFGYGPREFPGDGNSFLQLVHVADQERILAALNHSFATQAPYSEEYRIHRRDGALRWVSANGKVVATEDGTGWRIVGVVVDITERKQAEEALRDSEERLRLALAAADQGLYDLDLQTGDAVVSPTYATMLGYDPATFQETNAKWLQRLHPDDHERVGQVYRSYVTGEIPEYKVEFRQRMANGHWKWVLSLGKIVAWDPQGNPLRMLGTHTDMDERKQAEEALRASEERFRQIAENINEVFWLTDLQHEFLYVSPTYERIWGVSTQHLSLRNWQASIHPDDRDRSLPFIDADTNGYSEVEYRIIRPDGEIRWVRDRAFPIRDQSGQVYRIAGIAEDISDRKRLEEEQARLLAILEASSDYIGIASPEGQIIWMNRQLKQLRDLPADQPFDQIPIASCHPEWAWQIIINQGVPTAIRSGIWVGESALLRITGEEIPVSLLLIAHKSPTGQLQYLSAIMRDITVLKQAEENLRQINLELEQRVAERTIELVEAKEAAEAANRAKSVFLANMSHELRTPLNAILGFSQLMARDVQLPSKHLDNLQIINRSGEHLLALINDILEMSKIEAGRVTLNPTDFSLPLLLDSLTDLLKLKAKSKGLTFTVTYPSDLPPSIQADSRKLRQVLINLLGNAIKFTQTGYVALRVGFSIDTSGHGLNTPQATHPLTDNDELPDNQPDNQLNGGPNNHEHPPLNPSAPITPNTIFSTSSSTLTLRFEVEDTGCGMAPAELDVLFAPFVQASNERYSAQEGTGLGLSISQQFARLMGGSIWVESQVGVGSTFIFEVPVRVGQTYADERLEPQRRVIAIAPDQPQYRILIAEDNLGNRILLQDLLTDLGFKVQTANNGQEAIERWRTWHPHLIFMDIRMPNLNGYEAAQQIRQQEQQWKQPEANATPSTYPLDQSTMQPITQRLNKPTKIIALTAGAFEDNQTEFQTVGCDAFLRKPIREAEIIQLLAEHLGVRYLYESQDAEQPSAKPATFELTQAALEKLPHDWLLQLYNAITQLDRTQMFALVEALPSNQTDLAQALEQKIRNFDYEMLLNLIQDILNLNG